MKEMYFLPIWICKRYRLGEPQTLVLVKVNLGQQWGNEFIHAFIERPIFKELRKAFVNVWNIEVAIR